MLAVERGAYLFASRNPRDYDLQPGVCGTITPEGTHGCKTLINGEGVPDLGVMGDGVHNHFYSGHGMSIGSTTDGGASAIRVSDLTIDQSDNGLRIKSNITRGGLVHDVQFEDVCMRDTPNPIILDTSYTAHTSEAEDKIPVFRDIVVRNVLVEGPGTLTLDGHDPSNRIGIQFDNVAFTDASAIQIQAKNSDVKIGPGAFNLNVAGQNVTVSGTAGQSTKMSCAHRFVDFPTQR